MSEIFGPEYAQSYDVLATDRDFAAECDVIEQLIAEYGSRRAVSILDLGCGTGGHALVLAARGYDVAGFDRSSAMIAEAIRKAAASPAKARVTFGQCDARHTNAGRRFDVVSMVGGMIDYQEADHDVLAVLVTARRHLHPGGLLLFSMWYGPAVVHQRPSARVRTAGVAGGQVRRSAAATLDAERRVCTISFHLVKTVRDIAPIETVEHHTVRYFYRDEIESFLAAAGFALACFRGFPDISHEADETAWNVIAAARAV